MIRDIFTNKWIIGAAFGLLIVAAGCFWYYQQTTQAYKQEAEQADKLLQQWEADKAQQTTTAEKEETNTPAEGTTSTAEKSITEITPDTDKTEPSQAQTDSETQTTETAEVRVSPFGFGPYPEVPADYPYPAVWDVPSENEYEEHIQRDHELIDRVTIKLWTQGIVSYGGVMGENDLVYPNLKDTVYVEWAYGGPFDDLRYPAVIQGDPSAGERMDEISREKHERRESFTDADIPSDITVVPYDEGGIDPYTFLGLPKK